MKIIKLWYHICTCIKKTGFKIIYGKRFSVGKRTHWRKDFSVMLDKNASLTIGNNCFFNNGCSIESNEQVVIKEGCLFGENVKIYDHNHRFRDSNSYIKNQGYTTAPVEIGNNCWIGSNVVILKGTTIEDHCVIGAGAVIEGRIPANTIVKSGRNVDMFSMEE